MKSEISRRGIRSLYAIDRTTGLAAITHRRRRAQIIGNERSDEKVILHLNAYECVSSAALFSSIAKRLNMRSRESAVSSFNREQIIAWLQQAGINTVFTDMSLSWFQGESSPNHKTPLMHLEQLCSAAGVAIRIGRYDLLSTRQTRTNLRPARNTIDAHGITARRLSDPQPSSNSH